MLRRHAAGGWADGELLPSPGTALRVEGFDNTGVRSHASSHFFFSLLADANTVSRPQFLLGEVSHTGAVLVYQSLGLLWRGVACLGDVTPASLSPLLVLRPRPEVLVLGVGGGVVPRPPADVAAFLKAHGVALELQRTRDAAATYNLLCSEGRRAAFGGIPAEPPPPLPPLPPPPPKKSTTGPFPNWRDR